MVFSLFTQSVSQELQCKYYTITISFSVAKVTNSKTAHYKHGKYWASSFMQ